MSTQANKKRRGKRKSSNRGADDALPSRRGLGRVVFVTQKVRKGDLSEDEIVVRLPFPRETKWKPSLLGLTDEGKGTVGGVDFDFFGQSVVAKIDDDLLEAVRDNKLQVVYGRIERR